MSKQELYDKKDPLSIEAYAKHLEGHTFKDVVESKIFTVDESSEKYIAERGTTYYNDKKSKGSLGHLLEESYFKYDINPDQEADFKEAGVELKVTPYKENKNGTYSAKERLVITIIDYMNIINENFEDGHLQDKINLMLLIFYKHIQGIDKLEFPIDYVQLFQLPEDDLKIIKEDYKKIIDKIKSGNAHLLKESDTLYLGACTKGSTAAKSLREQPFSEEKAKQRAFCLKNSYMTYILREYIMKGKKTYEKIPYTGEFESYVLNTINQHKNETVYDLLKQYGIKYENRPKNLESNLAFKILGIKSNNAEEFVKAGIAVKNIRFDEKNNLKESVSFPTFKFMDIIKEDWENAEIYNYLEETKFLFITFKKTSSYEEHKKNNDFENMDKNLILNGAVFWSMPTEDLENDVRQVWEKTREVINNGIETEKHGNRTFNNLPKRKDSRVCHIRPHARDKKDVYPLPDGSTFTKQCFFLNSDYVRDEILKALKNAED